MIKSGYIGTGDYYRSSDSITGVLLDIRGKNPRPFIVLDSTGYWALRLSAYCKTVRVYRKNVKYVLRFTFRSLFSALFRFPNFAEALLQVEHRGYDETARLLLRHAWLARYTLPVALGDTHPVALGDAHPVALGDTHPVALGDAHPVALGDVHPSVVGQFKQAPQGATSTLFAEGEANADVLCSASGMSAPYKR